MKLVDRIEATIHRTYCDDCTHRSDEQSGCRDSAIAVVALLSDLTVDELSGGEQRE